MICEDVCFHFKNQLSSSETKDPTFDSGFAYFVEHSLYSEYIKLFVDHVEGSTSHRGSGMVGIDCV